MDLIKHVNFHLVLFGIFAFSSFIELGLSYAFVAIEVYLSFRILDFPDLTVDGSFLLGSCVCGVLILLGFNPWTAMMCAFFCSYGGRFVNSFAEFVVWYFKFLASILTMSAL
ncbi:hypothetical protein RM11_1212 [Bartonella quintana RM-11]|nr:hypothetical protein RM11_1212 [Bartonella quintana RM-11]